MRRTRVFLVIGFAVFVFLAVSALLARALSGAGAERSRVEQVARAEAAGDADTVVRLTPPCAAQAACVAATKAFVAKLKKPGDVEILTANEVGNNVFRHIAHPLQFKTKMLDAKAALEQTGVRS